jgi:hypothetical protein
MYVPPALHSANTVCVCLCVFVCMYVVCCACIFVCVCLCVYGVCVCVRAFFVIHSVCRAAPLPPPNVYSLMVYIPPDVTKNSAGFHIFVASTEYFPVPEQPGLYTRQECIPCLVHTECNSFLVRLDAWLSTYF